MRPMSIVRRIAVVTLLSLLGAIPSTSASMADPGVDNEGSGSFTGTHNWSDQPPKKGLPSKPKDTTYSSITEEPEEDLGPWGSCERGADGQLLTPWDCPVGPAATLDRATGEQLARRLIVRLQLPKPTPQFGPDPADNEWNMMAVGYPVWLWTEGTRTVTATESAYGYTFTLRAHYRSTTFEMGDGKTKRCTDTTAYRKTVKPGTASPTCGYTYLKPAHDGTYTVTATTHWDVDWSVAGFSGTLPGTHSASRQLPVGELQAIVVK